MVGIVLLAISMLLGVLGVLYETRDKASGRLTTAGKLTIAGIVLSAVLGISQQAIDNRRKERDANDARDLAYRQLESLQKTVRDINRNMQLLPSEVLVDLEISIPCRELEMISEEAKSELCRTQDPFFLELSSGHAKEIIGEYYVSQVNVLLFAPGKPASASLHEADIVATFWPEKTVGRDSLEILKRYDEQADSVVLTYHRASAKMMQNSNRILSLPDLRGAKVGIELPDINYDYDIVGAAIITPMGVRIPVNNISRSRPISYRFIGAASIEEWERQLNERPTQQLERTAGAAAQLQ